jgi:AsmA protein
MHPLLKWIAITAAVLLLLAGGAVLLIRVLVDEEDLGAALLEVANRHIDGELRIDGGLRVSLWPTLSLAARDVHLRTPAGASADFAAVRELRLGVALLPLLKEELQVRELLIDGLTLNAECEAGSCNWAGLAGGAKSGQPGPPADPSPGAAAPMLLNIARVRLADSTVTYTDRSSGARYELSGLELQGEGINLDGEAFGLKGAAVLAFGEPRREMAIAVDADIDADREAGTVALGAASLSLTPAGSPALTLDLPAALIDLDARTLDAPALTLASDGVDLDAALKADWSKPGEPAANGRIDLKKLDLPALLAAAGTSLPPAINAEPVQDIALAGVFTLAQQSLTLEQMKLRAGSFSGEGRLKLGLGGTKRIDATLASPELDLDYFLPPPEIPPGNAEEPAPPAAAGTPQAESAGLAALLTVDGAIDAQLGRLKRGKLELGDIRAALQLARGSARLQKLEATLYGGTLKATGTLSAGGGADSMQLDAQLAAVDARALLGALTDMENLEGRIDGSASLRAGGSAPADWMGSLRGPVQLGIAEPVLRGLSIEEAICKAAAQLNQEALTASFEPITRFESIRTALDFQHGVGTFRQLGASVPNMTLRGEGRIDLPRRKLDIQLNARVNDDLSERDAACRMTRKMLAVEWPVTCKGSFDEDPQKWCGIDKDDVAKIAAQLATEKIQDKLMKKLGNFFDRD